MLMRMMVAVVVLLVLGVVTILWLAGPWRDRPADVVPTPVGVVR